jgi:hypothetical protein
MRIGKEAETQRRKLNSVIATNIGRDAKDYVTISVPGSPAHDMSSATFSVRQG